MREEYKRRLGEYLLRHPCVDCGEKDIRCLDFDHDDAADKRGNIARMINELVAWSTIEDEIRKCKVRCANCHRRRTAQQFSQWRQRFFLRWQQVDGDAADPAF